MNTGSDWQSMGYKWMTMTGISAVLLTGWMLLDSKMVVLGGQASVTTPQALGASPKSYQHSWPTSKEIRLRS
ncbi:hypothetical protein P9222_33090 [Paenibacillus amylolyticus]|nr:hypothetical protein [Paenibacillus amylolyticus]WFR62876.1 hypothetical protein P9222_33090 [Paenibacillus amylolyticus]